MTVGRVTITFNTCVIACACFLTSSFWAISGVYIAALLSIIAHELGHVLCLFYSRKLPTRVYISFLEAFVLLKSSASLNKFQDYAFVLGGPLATLLLFAFALLINNHLFATINFVMLVQNVYPTRGNDGHEFCMSVIKHNKTLKNVELVAIARIVILLVLCVLSATSTFPVSSTLVSALTLYVSFKTIAGI